MKKPWFKVHNQGIYGKASMPKGKLYVSNIYSILAQLGLKECAFNIILVKTTFTDCLIWNKKREKNYLVGPSFMS